MDFGFTVYGQAQPQGSTRAFTPRGWTKPVITTDNAKLKPWRQQLSQMALIAMQECGAKLASREIPISIGLTFVFEKPRSARKAAVHKTTKPDLDKLLRAVLDALTGIVYQDDSQVCECQVAKIFGSPARLEVKIGALAEPAKEPVRQAPLQLFSFEQSVSSEISATERADSGQGVAPSC